MPRSMTGVKPFSFAGRSMPIRNSPSRSSVVIRPSLVSTVIYLLPRSFNSHHEGTKDTKEHEGKQNKCRVNVTFIDMDY